MICSRFSLEIYAFHVLGLVDGPERDQVRSHLEQQCTTCINEMKRAMEVWYVFAMLTETLQAMHSTAPNPRLRRRVLGLLEPTSVRRATIPSWTLARAAAGVALLAGTAGLSWNLGRAFLNWDASEARSAAEQQSAAVKKLETENLTLRNSLDRTRSGAAPTVEKERIVTVPDPATVRELKQSQNAHTAVLQALNEEQTKVAELTKRLAESATQLAAATQSRDEAERRYRTALDSAAREKDRNAAQFATEAAAYKGRIRDLEAEIARYRLVIDSQRKGIAQHLQMASLLQSPSVSLVRLRATEAGRIASGVAIINDSLLVFYASNLSAAPLGRTYQLWLIRDKGPPIISAGIFNDIAKDTPSIEFTNKVMLSNVKAIALTEEPSGGSPLPTGHKLMIGMIKS